MPPRAPGAGAVPEVDRKGTVRKVQIQRPAGGEDADETGEERRAPGVPVWEWGDLVDPGTTALAHADVLEDARGDNRVEEPVGKRQTQPVRDDEPIAVHPGPPLPLAKRREVVSPGLDASCRKDVDRLAVPAARVEDAPGARRAQEREVVVLDPAARVLVLVSAARLIGEGRGVRMGVEVPALGEIRDAVVDGERATARRARQCGRGGGESDMTDRAHQVHARDGPAVFHSQKSLLGACPGRAVLSSDVPAALLQSPGGERGPVRRADPPCPTAARGAEELRREPGARSRGREARGESPEALPRDLREPHALAEDAGR